eukprot:133424_1
MVMVKHIIIMMVVHHKLIYLLVGKYIIIMIVVHIILILRLVKPVGGIQIKLIQIKWLNTFQHISKKVNQQKYCLNNQKKKNVNEQHHISKKIAKIPIQLLIQMIKNQQRINTTKNKEWNYNNDNETKEQNEITTYGQTLFGYFCNNISTTDIAIAKFESLPQQLYNVLFINQRDSNVISLLPIANLFHNITDLTLNDLNIDQLTQKAPHYIKAVMEYVHTSSQIFGKKLRNVIFESELQLDNKPNTALQQLVNYHSRKFAKYNWEIKYQFYLQKTHNITFRKYNISRYSSKRLRLDNINIFKTKHDKEIKEIIESPTTQMTTIWRKKPSYFMQVTSIVTEGITVELIADKMDCKMDRRFRINEVADNDSALAKITKSITIYKNLINGKADIAIDDKHDSMYHFALYDPKDTDIPLKNTSKLRLNILNKHEYPPYSNNYKPNPIDISTVFKVKNLTIGKCDIYWSVPSKSHGHIAYKIIHDTSEETKEEIIKILPYSIQLSSNQISFKVITITTIDGNSYESQPSETIEIPYFCPSIKTWPEFPDLLQILGVDEDTIAIKFDLKSSVDRKTKYSIQNIDDNDEK